MTVVVAIPKGVVADPGRCWMERWSLRRAFRLTRVTGTATIGLLILLAAASVETHVDPGTGPTLRGFRRRSGHGNPDGR